MAALWKYHQFEIDCVTEAPSFFFFFFPSRSLCWGSLPENYVSHVLSNQCSVAGLNAKYCPSLIFSFTFHLLFLCFAICHFSWKKHHITLKTVPCPHIYRGDVRRYKTSPPSFSMGCKLIGLCWLLWRYCLWWLPLAVFIFGPLSWFTMLNCMASYCGDHELCLVRCEFPLIILSWF